jgi:hypothetical protein
LGPPLLLPGAQSFDTGHHFGRELGSTPRAALSREKPCYPFPPKFFKILIERWLGKPKRSRSMTHGFSLFVHPEKHLVLALDQIPGIEKNAVAFFMKIKNETLIAYNLVFKPRPNMIRISIATKT